MKISFNYSWSLYKRRSFVFIISKRIQQEFNIRHMVIIVSLTLGYDHLSPEREISEEMWSSGTHPRLRYWHSTRLEDGFEWLRIHSFIFIIKNDDQGCCQAWLSEFDSWDPQSAWENWLPEVDLVSMYVMWHVNIRTHIHT